MGRARGTQGAAGGAPRRRPSKNQKRIAGIMEGIPAEREAMLTAMEAFGPDFELDALATAKSSPDPVERLKVAALERELEVLVNWLDEMASRGLAEGQRLGLVPAETGGPWERLARLGAISVQTADALEAVRSTRNMLGHDYPVSAQALHAHAESLIRELDRYTAQYEEWAVSQGILPPSAPSS